MIKKRVKIGAIIVLAFFIAVMTMALFGIGTNKSYESTLLLSIFNIIFLSIVPFITFYLLMKGYFKYGQSNFIFVGISLFILGLGSMVAAFVRGIEDGANLNVIAFNFGFFLASLFQLKGAISTIKRKSEKPNALKVIFLCIITILIFVLVMVLSLKGMFPKFFIQGEGPTLVRQVILASTIFLFIISAIIFYLNGKKLSSEVPLWYSMGLILMSIGLTGVFFQKSVGSIIGWIGRASQYTGGLYFLIILLILIRESKNNYKNNGE